MSDVRIVRHKSHYYITRGQMTRVRKSVRPYTHALVKDGAVRFSTSEELARKSQRKTYPDHELIEITTVSLDDFRQKA